MICFILLILLIFAGSWCAYAVAFYSPKHKRTSLDAPLVGDQYKLLRTTFPESAISCNEFLLKKCRSKQMTALPFPEDTII